MTEINQPDNASAVVGAEDLSGCGVDWAGPTQVTIDNRDVTHGRIIEAKPESGNVALSVQNATMLSESLLPPLLVQQTDAREVVYLVAREAGFEPEDIDIHGLAEAVRFEPLWVVTPLRGLVVRQTVKVGVVELMAGDAGREMLLRFSPALPAQVTGPLEDIEAFARVAVSAKFLCEAEREGLSLIDDAAAWLTTRLRYSWSHAPDGQLEPYERAATISTVERLSEVVVFPVAGTGRRWWRDTSVARAEKDLELLPDSRWLTPAMPVRVSSGDRQALLALQRAITARDPVQRVAALWEAIEFYLGDSGPSPEFTDDEITAAIARASEGMGDAKSERVGNVLWQWLNSRSPQARLKNVLTEERVPFTDEDMQRIRRLRRSRNRALHGAESTPRHDEIDQAVGLISRAMTTRWQER